MGRHLVIALALGGIVWGIGTFVVPGGGLDGPCLGSNYARGLPEGSVSEPAPSWLPPGQSCVHELPDGVRIEQTYPGPVTWVLAGPAFLVPFTAAMKRSSLSGSRS
jgi:hypothetical protein